MSKLTVSFGLRVREQRKLKQISQEKLAFLSNIDRSYMGRIERGEVNITIEKILCTRQISQNPYPIRIVLS